MDEEVKLSAADLAKVAMLSPWLALLLQYLPEILSLVARIVADLKKDEAKPDGVVRPQ